MRQKTYNVKRYGNISYIDILPVSGENNRMTSIQDMHSSVAKNIRWILTDIDDTLTKDGKLLAESYTALWQLKNAGLHVIAVTGRAAAWGYLLCHEWPVDGVISENGAVAYFIRERQLIETLAFPGAERNSNAALQRALSKSLAEIKRAKPAQDNHLRLYDIAVDFAENVQPPLSKDEVARIIQIFEEEGCNAQASSIHINTWKGSFNKKKASELFLRTLYNYQAEDIDKVFYVGDALNDEVMFKHFPHTCGVANIASYIEQMSYLPKWVSNKPYGFGFAEIAETLILKRNQPAL